MVTVDEYMQLADAQTTVNQIILINHWTGGIMSLGILVVFLLIIYAVLRSTGNRNDVILPILMFLGTLITGIGAFVTYMGVGLFNIFHFSVFVFLLIISFVVFGIKNKLAEE